MPFIPHKRRIASSWIVDSNDNQVKLSVKQNPQIEKVGGSLANVKKPNSDNKVQVLSNNSQAKDKIKTFINFKI
jgi:hypothetical protein